MVRSNSALKQVIRVQLGNPDFLRTVELKNVAVEIESLSLMCQQRPPRRRHEQEIRKKSSSPACSTKFNTVACTATGEKGAALGAITRFGKYWHRESKVREPIHLTCFSASR